MLNILLKNSGRLSLNIRSTCVNPVEPGKLLFDGDSPFTQPPLKVVEIWLQVADEQRLLVGHGYDGRVVRVEGQHVVRVCGHVVDIQTKEDEGDQSTLPAYHGDDVAGWTFASNSHPWSYEIVWTM